VMGHNPSGFRINHDSARRPVEQVTWHDAVHFCDTLSTQSGRKVRLPTEAEWEYACRAGSTAVFGYGGTVQGHQANLNFTYPYGFEAKGPYRRTTTVAGLLEPNAWGLRDMHGNVWEWCSDWYGPYGQGEATDPTGPETGDDRVCRGGSWQYAPRYGRAAYRPWGTPKNPDCGVGFRIVAEL